MARMSKRRNMTQLVIISSGWYHCTLAQSATCVTILRGGGGGDPPSANLPWRHLTSTSRFHDVPRFCCLHIFKQSTFYSSFLRVLSSSSSSSSSSLHSLGRFGFLSVSRNHFLSLTCVFTGRRLSVTMIFCCADSVRPSSRRLSFSFFSSLSLSLFHNRREKRVGITG